MNVSEGGVNIRFKSCFSKIGKLQPLYCGVLVSHENQREISTEMFSYCSHAFLCRDDSARVSDFISTP